MRMRGELAYGKEEEKETDVTKDVELEDEKIVAQIRYTAATELEDEKMVAQRRYNAATVGGGLSPAVKVVVVGYALTSKKVKSFLQPKLERLARSKGILFVAIDPTKPLSDQGPFDIVLHKLSGKEWRHMLEMSYRKAGMCWGGAWEGLQYIGGVVNWLFLPEDSLCYSRLLKEIHDIVQADLGRWGYVVHSLVDYDGRLFKYKIKNDARVAEVFNCVDDVGMMYVTLRPIAGAGRSMVTGMGYADGGAGTSNEPRTRAPSCGRHDFDLNVEYSPASEMQCSGFRESVDAESGADSGEVADDVDGCNDDDDDDDPRNRTVEVGDQIQQDTIQSSSESDDGAEERKRQLYEEICDYIRQRGGPSFLEPINRDLHHPEMPSEELRSARPNTRPWLIPDMPDEAERVDQLTGPEFDASGVLEKDSVFETKEKIQTAVGMYNLRHGVETCVERSSTTRYNVVCNMKGSTGCPFKLHARMSSGLWRVVKFVEHVGCLNDPDRSAPTQVSSKVIGQYFVARQFDKVSGLRPRAMIDEIRTDFGFNISYNIALKAKHYAVGHTYGDHDSSYPMLPAYMYQLESTNPGTYTRISVDEDDRLRFTFYALGASRRGFLESGRPVIVIDGTHTKGSHRGTMFVVVTHDPNHQIFPLALGTGDVESNMSWTWFLERLREAYGCPRDLLIVSDGHASIAHAISTVYPDAHHGLCGYHLKHRLAGFGNNILYTFQRAMDVYLSRDFDKMMELLRCGKRSQELMELVGSWGYERWSRVHCPVNRYEFMNSNAAESYNNAILWARKLPICTMLEVCRTTTERWFYERRTAAEQRSTILCQRLHDELVELSQAAQKLECSNLIECKFAIKDGSKIFTVDLNYYTCTCQKFQKELVPCIHAMKAIDACGLPASGFVSPAYLNTSVVNMWRGPVLPVLHYTQWDTPEGVLSQRVKPPLPRRQAGRPRMSRIRSGIESSMRQRHKEHVCSRCRQPGHNRLNCTGVAWSSDNPTPPMTDDPNQSIRRPKKCGKCGEIGHTRLRCPS